MKKTVLILICAMLASLPLTAETWNLDAAHSKLRFTAEARFISADGMFRSFKVNADINDQALEQSKVDMTVDVASLDTNSEKRDAHLRTDVFFDVAKFPTAQISSGALRKISALDYEGDGMITIKGVTKPIKLPAHILLNEGGVLRVRGTVTINRMDFGVSYNSTMNKIEDMVSITYELNLRKPRPAPGGAAPKTN